MAGEDRERALQRLRDELLADPAIAEARDGFNLVVGEGNPAARLVLVGEAPGAAEDRAKRPFVGAAGRLLDEALAAAELKREDVWITNAVKFRPTAAGEGGRTRNRAPTTAEVRLFRPWLERELAIIAPGALVCLGATAGAAVLERPVRITRERGEVLADPRGRPVVVTYHPAFLLRRVGDRVARFAELVAVLQVAARAAGIARSPDAGL